MPDRKKRAPRNRTITLTDEEIDELGRTLMTLSAPVGVAQIENRVIWQDIFAAAPLLPESFVDLLIVDPPYNLTKDFQTARFQQMPLEQYAEWLESWLIAILPILKPDASVYVCGDWRSSLALFEVLQKHFIVRNRITWEREKGRGSKRNWKNNAEDIWFCTVGEDYTFNVEAVKLKRQVIAPYRQEDGSPKDWTEGDDGQFRLTHPSNLWTDITVPFWSMPENTDHPTQKPEKLIAKLILASSHPGDMVFDPFLGSGTTAVVAKKLGRRFVGVEIDRTYCCLAQKRLHLAEKDARIQGYDDGVFWERNSR